MPGPRQALGRFAKQPPTVPPPGWAPQRVPKHAFFAWGEGDPGRPAKKLLRLVREKLGPTTRVGHSVAPCFGCQKSSTISENGRRLLLSALQESYLIKILTGDTGLSQNWEGPQG